MSLYKIIVMFFVVTILIFSLIICSSPGGFGLVQTEETTSGSIGISTMPANSEFLNEASE